MYPGVHHKLAALVIGWAASLAAQSFTASLRETVTDLTGAVIADAQVVLTNEATNVKQSTRTTDRGTYLFRLLPPGGYSLTVELQGFQTAVHTGMQLQVQQEATVDVALRPGDIQTRIVVSGEAPRLDVVNSTLGRVIENQSVLNMPLNTRDTLQLVMLTPGIVGSPGGTGTNFISNGIRNSQSDVLIDGITATVQEQGGGATDVKFRPSVEVVQEFKVQTNGFSSEYGFTGGAVINMVTRSGSNQFHGSLFEFHRNSAMNANDFFANRSGRTLVPFRRNQFGGALGGPVLLPKVYNGRDKTFFFFHYEANRQSAQATTLQTLPTALQKQGDFSDTRDSAGRLIQIFDPFSTSTDPNGNIIRAPFPNNTIPRARLNPVAARVVQFYPEPNLPGTPFTRTNNYFNSAANVADGYQTTMKLDHNFNEQHRLSGRYSRVGDDNDNANLWGAGNLMSSSGGISIRNKTNNAAVDYVWTISPTTLLNLRWGVSRQLGWQSPPCGECSITPSQLGFSGDLGTSFPPRFDIESYQSVGVSRFGQIRRGEDVNHISGNLNKTLGRHTLKFGGESRLYRLNYGQPGVNAATFTFARQTTMASPFRADSTQGDALAAFLLGWGNGGGMDTDAASSWAYQSHAAFYQHDWQVNSKLTLNFGIRYELPIPEKERYNRASWFNPLVGSPISAPGFSNLRGGLEFADSSTRSPYETDKNNWAPRFGFAYQFHPKTVLRGGYGIYYGVTRAQISSPLGPGFRVATPWNHSLDQGVTQYASLSNPFRDGINNPPGGSQGLLTNVGLGTGIAPIRDWDTTPYFQQWSMSIQRELPANSVVEVAYSGSRGVHLGFDTLSEQNRFDQRFYSLGDRLNDQVSNPFLGVITNPVSSLSRPSVARSQLLRPYPHFTGVGGYPAPPIADSIYHAAQVKFTKRYSNNLTASGHYTFSKMIDNNSLASGGQGFLGGVSPIQSYGDLSQERAVSTRYHPSRSHGFRLRIADRSWPGARP